MKQQFPIKVAHDSVVVATMKKQNPFQVTIDPYELVPRPEKTRCSSWVEKKGTRTFGFKSKDNAVEFQSQYGGKLTNEI